MQDGNTEHPRTEGARIGAHTSKIVRAASAAALIVALAACGTPPPAPTQAPGASRAPSPSSVAPGSNAASPLAPSSARSLNEYKREVALRIQQRSAAWVHDERPQALLRAVIVARIRVDAAGNPQVDIVRSPEPELTERVISSIRAAAPFAPPPRALAGQIATGYTETWLFNSDGRFQIRTVARPQMDE